MLLSSCFLSVQASQPNVATGQTKAFINCTLVVTLTDLLFQIFVNLIITAMPKASLDFTSHTQSASLVTLLLKYVKESTCSSFLQSTEISNTQPLFAITFVFVALISMLYSFAQRDSPAAVNPLVMLPTRRCHLRTLGC